VLSNPDAKVMVVEHRADAEPFAEDWERRVFRLKLGSGPLGADLPL
jgi:hypothetical protein